MNKKEFKKGLQDGIPIALGYYSVSLAFGVTAVLEGLPPAAAILISLTNLTSAGQFAGVNLIVTGGTYIEMIISMIIINLRYMLMSISMSQKVAEKVTLPQRLAISFGITDEIFAVSMQYPHELTGSYMAGLILLPVAGWTGGTMTGALVTSLLPPLLSNALGIALYGMFVAIVVPVAWEHRNVLFAVLCAAGLSCIFYYIPVFKVISSGWAIIIVTLLVSALAAWRYPIEQKEV